MSDGKLTKKEQQEQKIQEKGNGESIITLQIRKQQWKSNLARGKKRQEK